MFDEDLRPELGRDFTPHEAAWSKELSKNRKQLRQLKKALAEDMGRALQTAASSEEQLERQKSEHGQNIMRQVHAHVPNQVSESSSGRWCIAGPALLREHLSATGSVPCAQRL
jgi:hypothetical protein